MLNKLKINALDPSENGQRQTATPKSTVTDKSTESQPRSSYLQQKLLETYTGRNTEMLNLQNCCKLSENEYGSENT